MPGHGAVGGFGFDRIAIRREQDGGHEAERAKALRHGVRLHVAIVVLAGPNEVTVPFKRARDHIVDQAMLVGQAALFEFGLELGVVHFLEDILEASVIGLENRVLGREINRPVAQQAIVQTRLGEATDRIVEVIHAHGDAGAWIVEHIVFDRRTAVGRGEGHRQLAGARHQEIGGAVLVTEGVATDHDRCRPARDKARHVLADDGLAEHGAAEDVADRAVGRLPHLLEIEFLDALFVGGDRRAFDADAVLLDRLGGFDGNLVIGRVAMLDAEIVIFKVNVEIR